jgi:undecaprenyl-diphosphatase
LDILNAIILGLVQGLSEFLPISSSGHLVLAAHILDFQEEGIAFEVFVHFGTLLSVFVAFRREIKKMIFAPYSVWIKKENDPEILEFLNWDLYVIIGTIPAVIVGLFFKDQIENLFSSVLLVLIMLLITGTIMVISKFLPQADKPLKKSNSFIIGIAQAFAILPGISRSGSTIVTALAFGVDRVKAAKFSFILSIPAIIGATILKTKDLIDTPPTQGEILLLIIGAIAAFISGYFAIIWLLDLVKKGKLEWFGYYCFFISISGFLWYFLK